MHGNSFVHFVVVTYFCLFTVRYYFRDLISNIFSSFTPLNEALRYVVITISKFITGKANDWLKIDKNYFAIWFCFWFFFFLSCFVQGDGGKNAFYSSFSSKPFAVMFFFIALHIITFRPNVVLIRRPNPNNFINEQQVITQLGEYCSCYIPTEYRMGERGKKASNWDPNFPIRFTAHKTELMKEQF